MVESMYEEVKMDLEASTSDRFAGFGLPGKACNKSSQQPPNLPRFLFPEQRLKV
jgi:hypothetical protein